MEQKLNISACNKVFFKITQVILSFAISPTFPIFKLFPSITLMMCVVSKLSFFGRLDEEKYPKKTNVSSSGRCHQFSADSVTNSKNSAKCAHMTARLPTLLLLLNCKYTLKVHTQIDKKYTRGNGNYCFPTANKLDPAL